MMQAAKYLNVPVTEIHKIPRWWVDKAFIAMTAESQARKYKQEHKL